MTDVRFRDHPDAQALAEAVAAEIGGLIDSTNESERLLAFPGGTTPVPAFAALAAAPHEWEGVTIIPGDERLVSAGSPLSNFARLAEAFGPTAARVVPLAAEDDDYRAAGEAADAALRALPWPPQLAWLGMGGDGHTASIFPGPDLGTALESDRRAVGVRPDPLPPDAPVARVTLTRSAILDARTILVTIAGEAKRRVIESALSEGERSRFPIGQVLAGANRPIAVHWCP